MKPKAQGPNDEGLLEKLEDMTGSNQYVPAIEEAGKQVDALNDVRQEKLNRVKVVEKEKDGLEVPSASVAYFLV